MERLMPGHHFQFSNLSHLSYLSQFSQFSHNSYLSQFSHNSNKLKIENNDIWQT